MTGNLTETDKNGRKNYVQREEWPRAAQNKAEEKRILVEAENTDHEKLSQEMDPPVTSPIPVGDREMLRAAILRARLLDGTLKAPTARQKYLLGMAYLSGIRVEKDEERALRLLNEAADSGCGEAALQLGFMYLARVGVERDNDAALRWKERAFNLADQQFLTDAVSALELAHAVSFGSDGLVLMEYATDHPEKARDVCRRMRAMLQHAPENAIDREAKQVRLAETWLEASNIHFEKPVTLSKEELAEHRESVETGLQLLNALPSLDEEGQYQLAGGYGELARRPATSFIVARSWASGTPWAICTGKSWNGVKPGRPSARGCVCPRPLTPNGVFPTTWRAWPSPCTITARALRTTRRGRN